MAIIQINLGFKVKPNSELNNLRLSER